LPPEEQKEAAKKKKSLMVKFTRLQNTLATIKFLANTFPFYSPANITENIHIHTCMCRILNHLSSVLQHTLFSSVHLLYCKKKHMTEKIQDPIITYIYFKVKLISFIEVIEVTLISCQCSTESIWS